MIKKHRLTDNDVKIVDGVITACTYDFDKNPDGTDLIIPDKIGGQTVIGIGTSFFCSDVFANKNIISVRLPSTIQTIGDNAFSENAITSVDLSHCRALTTIFSGAFSMNQITTVNFTNCTALTTICSYAFDNSQEISVPGLADCTALTSVDQGAIYCPNLVIQHTLTTNDVEIEDGIITKCFYKFSKNIFGTSLIIPEQIGGQTVIGIGSEVNCCGILKRKNIVSVKFPPSIQFIYKNAFKSNCIRTVDLSNCTALITIGNYAFSRNIIKTVNLSYCTALTTIGKNAFFSNIIKTVNLSYCSALTTISKWAFTNNKITSVDFSHCEALTTIGDWAFLDNSITGIDFFHLVALTTIGEKAFAFNQITEVDLSHCTALTTIGKKAFANNSTIKEPISNFILAHYGD